MRISTVIPVWNGASVIANCLTALTSQFQDDASEIICVDNASSDNSAKQIEEYFPAVQLIRQPINLGFAGAVNVGIEAARGHVIALLNQDCLVQPGWRNAVEHELNVNSDVGIAGCAIYRPDSTLDHVGAIIQRADARGEHLTDWSVADKLEYVTGAAMALRRAVCSSVGRFDEGFYPAYFEDADYCFRARRKGIRITSISSARVIHLQSSREWQSDPIKVWVNQHTARYRFVAKHFNFAETSDFFTNELNALTAQTDRDQLVPRGIAARATLRALSDILVHRRDDLDETISEPHRRLIQIGLANVMRRAISTVIAQIQNDAPVALETNLETRRTSEEKVFASWRDEFPARASSRGWLARARAVCRRVQSIISGEEHRVMTERIIAQAERITAQEQRIEEISNQAARAHAHLVRHIQFLELLTDYEWH